MKLTCTLDIENNGLLSSIVDYSSYPYKLLPSAKMWVVSICDVQTKETKSLVQEEITKEAIEELLKPYDVIVLHNGHKFDLVVLSLFGLIDYSIGYLNQPDLLNGREVRFLDTMIMSRFMNPDRLYGHGLNAWGKRVGSLKTDYRGELISLGLLESNAPKGLEFSFFHPLMVEYCEQDCLTTAYTYLELLKELNGYTSSKLGLQMEHKLADLAIRRETFGFWFDKDLAVENIEWLNNKMEEIADKVNPLLPRKKLTKTALSDFTPPVNQIKKDGEWSSHMLRFFEKHNITEYNNIEKWFKYKGNLYECDYAVPLETTEEATIDDLDTVKHELIRLGWEPTEWRDRDLVRDSKKQIISLDKRVKALEKYVEDTLGGKYKEQRLEILGATEENLFSTLRSKLNSNRPVKVPTSPCIRVGVSKDLCPSLVELGDEVAFANDVAEYYTYRHRRSAIAGGDIGDLDFEDDVPETGYLAQLRSDGRISTPAIEIGTPTFRYKHIGVANVPRASSLFGKEMRSLFGCGDEFVQFGFDYASLEARIEGHYVFNYEGGEELSVSLLAEKPNDIHCYSEDTEILTEKGWLNFGEVSTDIKVAQYLTDTDSIEMVPPIEVVWQKYNGEMVRVKSGTTDQLITPNHRVLYFTEKGGNPVESLAKDLMPKSDNTFKTSSVLKTGVVVSDDFIRLVVATQADGHLSKDCSAITFSFTKVSKRDRILSILKGLGAEFKETKYFRKGRYEYSIRVKASKLTKDIREWLNSKKQFTEKILNTSFETRKLFIQELGFWDGAIRKNGDIVLDQTDRKSIDIVQSVCSTIGIKSQVNSYKKESSFGGCTIHRVYISFNSKPKSYLRSCNISVEKYDGYIGCVSVPSSYVVVRRNGKVFISGNTLTASKLGISRDSAKSTNYAMLYGASASKFVKMLGFTLEQAKKFVEDWWNANPALKQLKADKDQEWIASGKKYINSIDGRRINIRSQHSILNALFQSAGVICAKYVLVLMMQKYEEYGMCIDPFKGKPDLAEMISYHDEAQLAVNKEFLKFETFKTKEEAKEFVNNWTGKQLGAIQESNKGGFYITLPSVVSEVITDSITEVEEMFNMKVNLGYEYVSGRNWYHTH